MFMVTMCYYRLMPWYSNINYLTLKETYFTLYQYHAGHSGLLRCIVGFLAYFPYFEKVKVCI
jgi:hypothetical protein